MSATEKDKVNIRPMGAKDIDAVLSIYNKIREEKLPGVKRSRLTYRGALTYEQVASTDPGSPANLSFVAEVNGQVIGLIWGHLAYVGIPVHKVGLIHMLIVDPDYQRRGIARRLVNALTECCQAKGVNMIRGVLDERHWELRNYFQRLGFRRSELALYVKTLES